MDWNLKAPSWDLSEVDQANLTNMETMEGSSRYGMYGTNGEFSVDLKLGQVGNSGTESVMSKSKDGVGVSKMASSSSRSSKRARALSNGAQTVSCLVDGCHSDLSNCRDYHRRHKVCEVHSKTAQVTIGGQKQRFCQQCSRFHSLEEFDEGKRSCRKRLDGHNRRRRKPQPEPLTRSASFLSTYQGTQLLPFSSSHVYPSTTVVNPTWGGVVGGSADVRLHGHNQQQQQQLHLVDKQDLFLGSSSPTGYKEGKQVAFMQGAMNSQSPHLGGGSVGQAQMFLRTSPYSESGGLRCKMFSDSLTSSVHDSSRALSLLSSPQPHSPGNGLNQMVNPHSPLMQPLGLSLHDNSLDPVLGPSGSDHSSSMYNLGSNGSQGNDAPALFPFQWE